MTNPNAPTLADLMREINALKQQVEARRLLLFPRPAPDALHRAVTLTKPVFHVFKRMSDKDLVERPEDGPEDDREQTLVAHLIELRSRIVRMAVGSAGFACLSPFMKQISDYLSKPLMVALPQGAKLLATGVIAPFMVPLKVTLFVAFVIALPYVLWQLWGFIAPDFIGKRRNLAAPIIISSLVMFFLGMAYCYFIVFRMVFQFIAGFLPRTL